MTNLWRVVPILVLAAILIGCTGGAQRPADRGAPRPLITPSADPGGHGPGIANEPRLDLPVSSLPGLPERTKQLPSRRVGKPFARWSPDGNVEVTLWGSSSCRPSAVRASLATADGVLTVAVRRYPGAGGCNADLTATTSRIDLSQVPMAVLPERLRVRIPHADDLEIAL